MAGLAGRAADTVHRAAAALAAAASGHHAEAALRPEELHGVVAALYGRMRDGC